MQLKQLIYTLKTNLSKQHHISIKNTHIHELIASWYGFKSKASMNVSGICTFVDEHNIEENHEDEIFILRASSFGYSVEQVKILSQEIASTLKKLNFNFVCYEDLELEIPPQEEVHYHDYNALIDNYKTNLNQLKEAYDNGSSSAALKIAMFYEEIEDSQHSGVFYKALQKFQQTNQEVYEWYSRAADLGSIVAKATIGLEYGNSKYLIEAANLGNEDCIENLIRESKPPEEVHFWNELALLYGYDFTSSTAINDGGNWYVDYEGMHLPAISDAARDTAKKKAKTVFDEYATSLATQLS